MWVDPCANGSVALLLSGMKKTRRGGEREGKFGIGFCHAYLIKIILDILVEDIL